MWAWLTVACGLASLLGYLLADHVTDAGTTAEAYATRAVLTMLADSMMPEAFAHGGRLVGLLAVIGFLVARVLAVAQ